jgi:hypothetical protein
MTKKRKQYSFSRICPLLGVYAPVWSAKLTSYHTPTSVTAIGRNSAGKTEMRVVLLTEVSARGVLPPLLAIALCY